MDDFDPKAADSGPPSPMSEEHVDDSSEAATSFVSPTVKDTSTNIPRPVQNTGDPHYFRQQQTIRGGHISHGRPAPYSGLGGLSDQVSGNPQPNFPPPGLTTAGSSAPIPHRGMPAPYPGMGSLAPMPVVRAGLPYPYPMPPVVVTVPPSITPAPETILVLIENALQKVLIQDVPANVWLPGTLVITFFELQAFLPTMLQNPLAMHRLLRNGATRKLIAQMQLYATGELTAANRRTIYGRLKWQVNHAISIHFGTKGGDESQLSTTPFDDLTTATWRTRDGYKHEKEERGFFGHVKLRELWKNVKADRWPSGNDRGHLTQCLEYDRQHPELYLYTSHIPWLLERIQPRPMRQDFGLYVNADQEDVARWSKVDWAQLEAQGQQQEDDQGAESEELESEHDQEEDDEDAESEEPDSEHDQEAETQPPRPVFAPVGLFRPADPAAIAAMNHHADSTGLIPYMGLDHYPSATEMVAWLQHTFPIPRSVNRNALSRLWHWFLHKGVPGYAAFMQVLFNAYHGIIRGG